MPERTIILHYHLFKNAGTSFDRILKENFPGRWVTREFSTKDSLNTEQVEDWIRSETRAVAFSSHTMLGPLPKVDGVRILSVLFLRDPVARIVSAYNFERHQQADTFGAQLARQHDFEGYVRSRLATKGDRQCRNFQVSRLAAFVPGPEAELERASAALDLLTFVGRVEDFSNSVAGLSERIAPHFNNFVARSIHVNISERSAVPLDPGVVALLEQNNGDDRMLLQRFDAHRARRTSPLG